MCRIGDACRTMHIQTHVIRGAQSADPGVQPHAGSDHTVGRPGVVHQSVLSLHRCLQCVERGGEDGKEGIPLGLDHDAAVLRDGLVDEVVVCLEESDPVITEGLHQPCRAFDIGEEEGDGPRRQSWTSGGRHHLRR